MWLFIKLKEKFKESMYIINYESCSFRFNIIEVVFILK